VRTIEGKQMAEKKQYARAIDLFRAALVLCPKREEAAVELTRAYVDTRRFADAERSARDILDRNPASEPAQFLLAYSYFMRQHFQQAGQTLQRLLAQNDKNAEAHKLMGLTLFFYREDPMAERELLTALRYRPNDEDGLYYLGRIYYTQNNFPPAIDAFRRLIALDPAHYKAYDNLGLCYEATGRNEEAIAAFRKSQEIAARSDPGYEWPYANLAEMLIKQNRPDEALPYAQSALNINPQSARNQFLLGKALSRRGRPEAAFDHLRKAAQLDPNYPEPHYLLGQLYEKMGRRDDAQREFAVFEEISRRVPHKKR
jgi:protein O-GlcNAc transferase